ncbi:helix-turn-helix domain-containing protein [Trichormus azollae]|uniref:Putative transcriptional regulator, Crp/Fnr family with PAS/PAC sensor n=1 Tax=Nostoc azollae (strain 0708) TaxID=551115 RepID=D7DYR1_NOSA0|nr:helix-turn-helix domain-containing protein [Trichormus azollae]ADI64390.1 putative transcriptional regulator, Crp/Fnr family with PAS/PAC sensor ['Nostoc azollae' 0708]
MNIELFYQRAELLHQYLADLYQTAIVLPWIPSDLVPEAFKELKYTSNKLQLAAEELYHQNEELIQTRNLLETERQHYQELFEFAPDGYLVTNQQGIIQKANHTAAQLLNIAQNFLVGKPIINFIPREQYQHFYSELIQISQSPQTREILLSLKPRHGHYFNASLKVKSLVKNEQQSVTLYWLIRKITGLQQVKSTAVQDQKYLIGDRPINKHSKGESIVLNPLLIYYVVQGVVKLSTLCDTGKEVLTGLVTSGMLFSSSMTSLPIYQGTAITDIELVSIYISELTVLPSLSHILLPKIQQRLQQTESLLVIAATKKVEDRLLYLLEILKQQIGEPIPGGTRLTFRLTHQDIANACYTTRATITRLFTQLQKQGVISFDEKKHIICKNVP